jgi:hypothetical protein
MRTRERSRIIHVGQTGQYERTDPDYNDKRLAQLAKDYKECPKEWRDTFLAGLPAADIKALRERKGI